jgi:predicted LPLAT superfamily acyltransferase
MSGTATKLQPEATAEVATRARSKEWDGRTRTGFGILILYCLFRFLGPRFAYALLYPVALYYVIFNRKHGRAW